MRIALILVLMAGSTAFAGGSDGKPYNCWLECNHNRIISYTVAGAGWAAVALDTYKAHILKLHNDFTNSTKPADMAYYKTNGDPNSFSPTEKLVRSCVNADESKGLTFVGIVDEKLSSMMKCVPGAATASASPSPEGGSAER